MMKATSIRKPLVLIHPNKDLKKEVFGVTPTLYYRDEEEFFNALEHCFESRYDDKPERILRIFYQPGAASPVPRYARLRQAA